MIDIDKSMASVDAHPTFWVEFHVPGEETNPAIEIKAAPRQQRRLLDTYIQMTATAPSKMDETDEKQPMMLKISPDWQGLALALSEYAVNWKGFSGSFDKARLKTWFGLFSSCAIAFGQGFKDILDTYESDLLKKREEEVKN